MKPCPTKEIWMAFGTVRWNGEWVSVYAASRDSALLLFREQCACEGVTLDGVQRFVAAEECRQFLVRENDP